MKEEVNIRIRRTGTEWIVRTPIRRDGRECVRYKGHYYQLFGMVRHPFYWINPDLTGGKC